MFLTKLDLFGFKSFADRTVIDLKDGLTAICGPNGTGKSNIVEAIKWALGEQSPSSLRGGQMKDLLFGGSGKRKPLSFCDVTLTFLNTNKEIDLDFSEVAITRRLFRSGESEYLINKNRCRLKDIAELFFDVWGGKNSYSLIQQGQIEKIINSKPIERRAIFEEAAGLAKYKVKKGESLHKLEATQNNLVRIRDILSELENRLSLLHRQAGQAQRYQKIKERVKELELSLGKDSHLRLQGRLKTSEREYRRVKEGLAKLNLELNALSDALSKDKALMKRSEERSGSAKERMYGLSLEVNEQEARRGYLKERIRHIDFQKDKLHSKIGSFEERIVVVRESKSEEERERENLLGRHKAREEELALEVERTSEIEEKEEESRKSLEEAKVEIIDFLSGIAQLKNRIESRKGSLGHLKQRDERLAKEIEKAEGENQGIKVRSLELEKEVGRVSTEILSTRENLANLEKTEEEKEAGLDKVKENINHWQGEKKAASAKLAALKGLEDNLVGYSKAVRQILKRREGEGICGLVIDLIKIPSELEIALEAYLGKDIQAIVTETFKDAQNNLSLVNEAGQVTFIPLEFFNEFTSVEPKTNPDEGVIGEAKKLVEFEDKYRKVFEYLLDGVLVVKDLEAAQRLARESSAYLRFLTLKGEVVDSLGILRSGHHLSEEASLLKRKRTIKDLEESLPDLEQKLTEGYRQKLTLSEEIYLLQEQIKESSSSLHKKEIEKVHLAKDLSKFKEFLDNNLMRIEVSGKERDEIREEEIKIGKELEELLGERDRKVEANREKDAHISYLEEEFSQHQRLLKECSLKVNQMKVSLAELAQKKKACLSSIENLSESLKEKEIQLRELREELSKISKEEIERKDEMDRCQEKIRMIGDGKLKEEEKWLEVKKESEELKERVERKEEEVLKIGGEIKREEGILYKQEIGLAEVKLQMESIGEEFRSLNLEEGNLGNEERERAALELSKLKKRLDNYGEVNMLAPSEYRGVKERYDFLDSQSNDLTLAREDLLQLISKIDETTKDLFLKRLAEIGQNFNHFFREIFGGGQAGLKLTSDDPLEAGIRIEACPPGKRLGSISLLSGGEKALTALALLFAIFNIQPSSFCLLDEVDAALDEANIDRFVNLLNKFSQKTQFIIVTHSKKTIAACSTIYGTTMEEEGVTKIVSLSMEETRKD
ncbi:chromosome segregation protein SMC [bacterium]|nr:chromosome segregation protein SMC [bacterium]